MLLYSVRKGVNSAFWNAEELCLASSECVVGPVLAIATKQTEYSFLQLQQASQLPLQSLLIFLMH